MIVFDTLNNAVLQGWHNVRDTWAYATSNTITVPSDATSKYKKGFKLRFDQSQAYTNDPAAGSGIVLNMTDTSGFKVGNTVTVTSSAGSETATITAISTNVSITVNTLALNHTTTESLVTATKYFYMTNVTSTVVTITGGIDFGYANSAINNIYVSSQDDPWGFPEYHNFTPTYTALAPMTFTTVTTNLAKFRLNGKRITVVYSFSGTTGGTASNTIFASLPSSFIPNGVHYRGGAAVIDTLTEGGAYLISTDGTIGFRRSTSAAFGLGTGRVFYVTAEYEIA